MSKEFWTSVCIAWLLFSIIIFLASLMLVGNIPIDEREFILYVMLFSELSCVITLFCIWKIDKAKNID